MMRRGYYYQHKDTLDTRIRVLALYPAAGDYLVRCLLLNRHLPIVYSEEYFTADKAAMSRWELKKGRYEA